MSESARPLDGVRVVEVGQLLAGPFAGTLLAYFGADVIKVEPLGGDALRSWRGMDGDTSVWWRSLARNKRCVAIDLHRDEGRALVRDLIAASDVLVENFRPGTMEDWGLGPEALREANPKLVYARVSGFGQTGPDRRRAGFASVCEAEAGLRHITGVPGEPPVRSNVSLGDSLGGIHAMMGILLALMHRDRTGRGQVVDVALTESVLNVLESVLPEYHALGIVRPPSGPTITGVVPSNAYRCADGRLVVVGANTDGLFTKLMSTVGREDLASRPDLENNRGRVEHAREIDEAIEAFTSRWPIDAVLTALGAAGIPAGPVADAAHIAASPQLAARDYWERAEAEGKVYTLPALAPRLAESPGRTGWAGPAIGAHTQEVLSELGLEPGVIDALRARGVVR